MRFDLVPPDALTSTLLADGRVVPWLAAEGLLSFDPEHPPESNRESVFDYRKMMPNLIESGEHSFWGAPARINPFLENLLKSFWALAHVHEPQLTPIPYEPLRRLAIHLGQRNAMGFDAPIAVYEMKFGNTDKYILLQAGSYQILNVEQHPEIEQGYITLYRGIRQNPQFVSAKTDVAVNPRLVDVLNLYYDFHYETFKNSQIAFSLAHAYDGRSETDHIGTTYLWQLEDQFFEHHNITDLNVQWNLKRLLKNSFYQAFSFVRWIAENKFGPNYVAIRTPLTNIRFSNIFVGEEEVTLINPNRIEIIGCQRCNGEFRNFVYDDLNFRDFSRKSSLRLRMAEWWRSFFVKAK